MDVALPLSTMAAMLRNLTSGAASEVSRTRSFGRSSTANFAPKSLVRELVPVILLVLVADVEALLRPGQRVL
jgi:hypothetical protein